jgi:hypothetical protein
MFRPLIPAIFRAKAKIYKGKDKAVTLQARNEPECSRKLRFLVFMTKVQDGGKVVSFKHRPSLPPVNVRGTHFLLEDSPLPRCFRSDMI